MQVTTHSGTNFGRKMSLMLRTFSLWFHRQRSELCGKKLHPIWPHFVTKLSRSWSMLLIVVAEWHMSNRQVSSPYKPQSHKDLTQEGTVQMTRKHLKIKKKKVLWKTKTIFILFQVHYFFFFLIFSAQLYPPSDTSHSVHIWRHGLERILLVEFTQQVHIRWERRGR